MDWNRWEQFSCGNPVCSTDSNREACGVDMDHIHLYLPRDAGGKVDLLQIFRRARSLRKNFGTASKNKGNLWENISNIVWTFFFAKNLREIWKDGRWEDQSWNAGGTTEPEPRGQRWELRRFWKRRCSEVAKQRRLLWQTLWIIRRQMQKTGFQCFCDWQNRNRKNLLGFVLQTFCSKSFSFSLKLFDFSYFRFPFRSSLFSSGAAGLRGSDLGAWGQRLWKETFRFGTAKSIHIYFIYLFAHCQSVHFAFSTDMRSFRLTMDSGSKTLLRSIGCAQSGTEWTRSICRKTYSIVLFHFPSLLNFFQGSLPQCEHARGFSFDCWQLLHVDGRHTHTLLMLCMW